MASEREQLFGFVSYSCEQGFKLLSMAEHARCTSGEFKPILPGQDRPIYPLCICDCHEVPTIPPSTNGSNERIF